MGRRIHLQLRIDQDVLDIEANLTAGSRQDFRSYLGRPAPKAGGDGAIPRKRQSGDRAAAPGTRIESPIAPPPANAGI